jgi:predicted CoA-binding protein
MEDKLTLMIGASLNPDRESYSVLRILIARKYPVVAIGLKEGELDGLKIQKGTPAIENVHTITLYLGAKNQVPLYDYILGLKPKRLIFNPGAENEELMQKAIKQGINAFEACTHVMLSQGIYDEVD